MSDAATQRVRIERAHEHLRAGRLRDAELLYRQVLTDDSHHVEAMRGLAAVAEQVGRLDAAATILRQATTIALDHAPLHAQLGETYRKLGRLDEAEAFCQRAAQLDPSHVDAWYNLGVIAQLQGRWDAAADAYQRVLKIKNDHAAAHYNLGHVRMEQAAFAAAADHFTRVAGLLPRESDPLVNLGLAQEKLGEREAALATFQRALSLGVSDAVQYHLAALTGLHTPAAAPRAHVIETFDRMAERFDRHLVKNLDYHVPEKLLPLIKAVKPAGFGDVVDLGCGTGLCGPLLKTGAGSLVGVDLSPGMIEKARNRNVYDALHVAEAVEFLQSRPGAFDTAIAADVLVYLGDLALLFDAVRQSLRTGGVWAFSVEVQDGDDYTLRATRRYAHSEGYLRRLAATYGFTVKALEHTTIRLENHQPVPGLLVVMQR